MNKPNRVNLPHSCVYTRLRPSRVHKGGVGVFAIRPIKAGANIFPDDNARMTKVLSSKLRGIPRLVKQLYDDFPVVKDGGRVLLCPRSFNLLTVAWYINESRTNPNVHCDPYYNFFASRDIKVGEELTADYSTYNEF